MADTLAGGKLADLMASLYADTGSWEEVSRRLYADCRVSVTGQSLRRWATDLGIGEAA